jgi:hypothetical protein
LLIIVLILGTTVIYNLQYFKCIKIDIDEGLIIAKSERILHEPFPYIKFDQYFFGKYYLLAGFFKLFGRTIAVARILFILIHCLNNVLAFLIARKIMSFPYNLLPVLLLLLAPGYWHKSFIALLLLFNLFAIFNLQKKISTKPVILFSLVVGFSFYFRIDIAGYGLITAVIVIAVGTVMKKTSLSKATASLAMMALFTILAIAPLFILHGLNNDWEYPINRIANDIKNANQQSISFPGPDKLLDEPTQILAFERTVFFMYTSVLAFVLAFLFLVTRMRQDVYFQDIKNEYLLSTLVLGVLSFNHIWPFATHIFRLPQSGIVIHILWAFLIYQAFLLIKMKKSNRFTPFVVGFCIFALLVQVYYLCFCFLGPTRIVNDASTISQRFGFHLKLNPPQGKAARGLRHLALKSPKGNVSPPLHQARPLNRVDRFIRNNTRPDEKIFCFHEAIFYFLSERKNATDYTNMRDMLVDEKARRHLRNQLVHTNPKLIICKKVQFNFLRPNLPELYEKVLKRRYLCTNIFGYRIYIRKKTRIKK